MSRNARSGIAVALSLAVLLFAAGCRHRSGTRTTVETGGGIFTTDNFPGAPVQNGNVADDQRGMSPSGEDYDYIQGCFPNGDRGTALVVFKMLSGQSYVTYYDGESWTPPVILAATDCVLDTVQENVFVAWINTEGHPSGDAQNRDGDAVILWRAEDADGDGAADADDVNMCLWMTYFNVRQHDSIGDRYGFQEFASRLNDRDMDGEDVQCFGVVSDGLQGEARWNFSGYDARWGDATTSIEVVWHQREDNDGSPGFEDRAMHARRLILDSAIGDDLPLVTGAGVGPDVRLPVNPLGASDSGISSGETQVDFFFTSYNNTLFFRLAADNTGAFIDDPSAELEDSHPGSTSGIFDGVNAGVDQVIESLTFDPATGTPSSPVVLHAVTPDSTDALANDASIAPGDFGFQHFPTGLCYGSDEGLAALVIVTLEFDQDADGAFDAVNSGRLALSEVSESTGAMLSHTLLGADDPAVNDTPEMGAARGVLGRNGDYLVAVWVARSSDGASNDRAIFAANYVTTRIAEDGSYPALPAVAMSLSPVVPVNPDLDGSSAFFWAFQQGLGYVCGIQSDPDVVNLMYEHGDPTYDEIFVARLTAGPGLPASLAVAVTSVDIEDNDVGWRGNNTIGELNEAGRGWTCIDSGSGGNALVVYDKDVIAGAGEEHHYFSKLMGPGSAVVRVDSGIAELQARSYSIFLVGTPAGSDIRVFDPVSGEDSDARANPLQAAHTFFLETDSIPVPGIGASLRTRRFNPSSAATFGESWTPSAGSTFEPAFEVDVPEFSTASNVNTPDLRKVFRCGTELGFYFRQAGRIYYQEFDGGAGLGEAGWHNEGGVSDPFLVDDDSDEQTANVDAPAVASRNSCCDLPGAMQFWGTKPFGSSHIRLHVRVRDGGNN
ncbi:MAG: hypothetical protein K8T20_03470 [Planctomycetes bacterium]|nr:hypothetical protein [Planctomycetota bacterium]